MEKAYTKTAPNTFDGFTAAREYLEHVIRQLQSPEAANWRHEQTEETIRQEGDTPTGRGRGSCWWMGTKTKVIRRVFKRHDVQPALILDFIPDFILVLEYRRKAACCFFASNDKEQAKEAE